MKCDRRDAADEDAQARAVVQKLRIKTTVLQQMDFKELQRNKKQASMDATQDAAARDFEQQSSLKMELDQSKEMLVDALLSCGSGRRAAEQG